MNKIIAVIPTFNRKNYLNKILIQLRKQMTNEFELNTIVVSDGSNDGTLEMLENDFPEVIVVKGNGEWWYTKSMNEGFRKAGELEADYILTLNDDVEVGEDYVLSLWQSLKNVGSQAIMGSISYSLELPRRISFSGVREIQWWRFKYRFYRNFGEIVDPELLSGIYPSAVLPGRGMLIPFNILKELLYFDEKFVQYGSDDDFCLRAAKQGYDVYISWDARIFSHTKLTGSGSPVLKPSWWVLLKKMMDVHSPVYLGKNFRIAWRNGNKAVYPLTCLILVFGLFITVLKYKR